MTCYYISTCRRSIVYKLSLYTISSTYMLIQFNIIVSKDRTVNSGGLRGSEDPLLWLAFDLNLVNYMYIASYVYTAIKVNSFHNSHVDKFR